MYVGWTGQRVYSASAIPLKWLYAKQKSPVYSHFEETICGTATVRAYRKQTDFEDMCDQLTDHSHQPWHQYLTCWRSGPRFTKYCKIYHTTAVTLS